MRTWLFFLGLALLASAGVIVAVVVEARLMRAALLDLRGGNPEESPDE